MRLLLRANSHERPAAGETRLAASPDTAGRERWQWDLRVLGSDDSHPPGRHGDASLPLARSDGSTSLLALRVDPDVVAPQLEVLDLATPVTVERGVDELLAFVVGRGVALVEGRHVLGELDVMVLAGDDPTDVGVEQISAEPTEVALARLRPNGTGSLAWVP